MPWRLLLGVLENIGQSNQDDDAESRVYDLAAGRLSVYRSINKGLAVVCDQVILLPTAPEFRQRALGDLEVLQESVVGLNPNLSELCIPAVKILVRTDLIPSVHQLGDVNLSIEVRSAQHQRMVLWSVVPQLFRESANQAAAGDVDLLKMHGGCS